MSLTDAVVSQIAGQALPLVFRVVLPLPQLELLTGHVLVLRLPLGTERNNEPRASCTEACGNLFLSSFKVKLTAFLH